MAIAGFPTRSGGSRGPNFPKSQSGTSVSVSPGKGAVRIGPTHCTATRSAPNLKGVYHTGSSY